MITIQLSNFNKTLKIIDQKNKTAPTFNKKPFFIFKIKSTIKNHLSKVQFFFKKSKYKFKKSSEQN